MTVSAKLKTCLTSLKTAQSSLESFALETNNQMARQSFSEMAEQTKNIAESLESRIRQVEQEEPQYKA